MKLLKVINLAHLFGIVWLFSMIAFGVLLSQMMNDNGAYHPTEDSLLLKTIITGVIAFFGAFILYTVHYLFLRKKDRLGTPGSVRRGINPAFLVVLILLLGFVGVVAVNGAYNLGQADKFLETSNVPETTNTKAPAVTETVKYVESAHQPTTPPVIQEQPQNNQSNLVSCHVYGQTFNLTPEKCRYYQSEEAGADKALNSGSYTPPTQYETTQTSTPIPTSAPEKYHSTQEECRKSCYATYQNYPDTSLAKQQCVNSCQ